MDHKTLALVRSRPFNWIDSASTITYWQQNLWYLFFAATYLCRMSSCQDSLFYL